jgi:predicted amidophosphoribosyltransferase
MRDRHVPRLCRVCTSPMARQQEVCWNCGAAYAPLLAVGRAAPLAAAADDRWDDDGGHAAPLRPQPLVGV